MADLGEVFARRRERDGAPWCVSNSADTARADAGSSERAGRTHANATCGVMMTAEAQEEEPMVTAEGGVRAPKLQPETGRRK